MEFLKILILFAVAFVGGLIPLFFKEIKEKHLKILLSLSGAYLFSITIIHLIPEVYSFGGQKIGVFILVGFFLQLGLEHLTRGIEHGHIHAHKESSWTFAIPLMIGLSIHAFLEGIPIGGDFLSKIGNTSLLMGIAFHKLPAAFALSSLLILSGISRKLTLAFIITFALMSPLGALLGEALHLQHDHEAGTHAMHTMDYIMCIVIGSFFHISTTILFESSSSGHNLPTYKLLAILAGAGLALLSLI